MESFLAFLGVSLIVIVTPGPDTAVTIRNTLIGGRSGGVSTALGIAGGQTIWAFATSIGIVTLLVASAPLFLAVKYAGAAYLAYLGVQALRDAIRPAASRQGDVRPGRKVPLGAVRRISTGPRQRSRQPEDGCLLRGPPAAVHTRGEETFSALMRLGAVFAMMTFAWLALYAAVVARAGDILRRQSIRRSIEAVTGTLLIGLGLRIATERG